MKITFIAFIAVLIVVLINILINKIIKMKTVRHYLQPYFKSKNVEISKVKFAGFFDNDFDVRKTVIKPIPVMGNAVNNNFYVCLCE
ncbi:hypothetical protein D3C87_1624240 [compost metagenome]